jgi:hypothetical protein
MPLFQFYSWCQKLLNSLIQGFQDTVLKIVTKYVTNLKGQSHEIFDPRFFSANNTPGSPDSWAKAVLNINS